MIGRFVDVIVVLDRLRAEGVFSQYALAGAVAVNMWVESAATQDLDVAIIVAAEEHPLDPLRPVSNWLHEQGFTFSGEHVEIGGVPVQFMPVWHPLVREAVEQAAEITYDPSDPTSLVLRVMTPTYLVALWKAIRGAETPRRRERAAQLREAGLIDEALLADLLRRYGP